MTGARFSIRLSAWVLLASAWSFGADVVYRIQTIAGSNAVGDGGSALNAQLSDAQGLALDRFGAVYIADPDNHRVRKVSGSGVIQTIAGNGFPGFSGDGGPAINATLNAPYGVAADSAGNVYIADLGNNRVRRISPDGVIATIAGTGQAGSDGDYGRAVAAQLNAPRNVAADAVGNVYISEFGGHRVRWVTPDGLIRTVAGTGTASFFGDGGSATNADVAYPAGLAVDSSGALFIADTGNLKIRRVFGGVITTLATPGYSLTLPTGVCLDGAGGLYIADSGSRRVLRRASDGTVSLAPTGPLLSSARDVITDGLGNLLIADGRRVRLLTGYGLLTTFAGDGTFGYSGDGGPATRAALNGPDGIAVGADGALYIADGRNQRMRKVTVSGDISTIAGDGTLAPTVGSSPTTTPVLAPEGVLVDSGGVVWFSERLGNRVRRLTPSGALGTVAGNGAPGFAGDARAAVSAQLQSPGGVALDGSGNLFIADAGNHRVRRVAVDGTITTFAGTGAAGFSGDGGQAGSAQLNGPRGVALDPAGNLYIADTNNNRIRKVTAGGVISTVAGEGETPLNLPRSVAIDPSGSLFVADTENHRIVRQTAAGASSVIAGLGRAAFGGDGGAALGAGFRSPAAITIDAAGNLFVADLDNNRIRKLTPEAAPIAAPATEPPKFLHAATLNEGPVAPGELLLISGAGVGPAAGETAETAVLFDGRAAAVLDLQSNQIRVQVPYGVAGQETTHVEIFRGGERKGEGTITVTRATPGIFPRISNPDGSVNSADSPAAIGSTITFFVTGEGQPLGDILAFVGGYPSNISFVGAAPGLVGTLQVNVDIPPLAPSGAASLSISVGSAVSQAGVVVYVK